MAQRLAPLNQLHRVVQGAVVLAALKDLGNTWMVELLGELDLVIEVVDVEVICHQLGSHELESQLLGTLGVADTIDRSKHSFAEL